MKQSLLMLNSLMNKRYGQIKIAIFLFLLVFSTTFPKYIEILNDGSPVTTYAYFFEKIEHPLSPSLLGDTKSHGAKIAFRLTAPLIAKLSGTHLIGKGKGVIVVYIIQSSLLLPFFFLLIKTIKRFANNLMAFLLVVSFSAIYVTNSFFWDYDFWFDGYAYFFLMLSMYYTNKTGILIASQLACWTDERAVIALYSVYIFHLLNENNFVTTRLYEVIKINLKNNSSIVLLSGIIYATIRISLSYFLKLNTPLGEGADAGFDLIPYQINNRIIGVFLTFEGLWLIFLIALFTLISQRKYFLSILLLSITGIHILVAYSVFDITRSLSYAFPIFIICAAILAKNKLQKYDLIFYLSAIICILTPTQFLIFFPRNIPWTLASYPEIKTVIKNLIYNF
ncbi:hypothetical protein ACFP1I_25300 [Dyadobacter subterraneus]|uniref:HTTM domain-containing protein n=1 Tax=Dyadobacter subterraneus TaxID=2773304 RepID=A0ABR9WPG5_9BACT|nr:hypothetical protein [Dyadobacter subterraneus]MBE9466236.1 hypothetical protein [Dyadobacter subterraneus]